MLKLIAKISVRNLIRYRSQSIVGIIGFVIAITSTMFIAIYAYQEYNYNSSIRDHSKIFRLEKANSIYFQGAVADIIKEQIPEVEYIVKLNPNNNPSVSHIQTKETIKGRVYQTVEEWNHLFKPEILSGDINDVLNTDDKIAIDQKTALSLFGDSDAIGQSVYLNHNFKNREKLTVAAVYKNYPVNSSMRPIGLYNLKNDEDLNSREFDTYSIFIKLTNKDKYQQVLSKIHSILVSEKLLNPVTAIQLTSLHDIHFSDYIDNDFIARGNRSNVNTLLLIGILILLLSILNYQNFTIALSEKKQYFQKIHISLGANKNFPLVISLIESLLLCLVAGVISLLLYPFFTKVFFLNYFEYDFGNIAILQILTLVFIIYISLSAINTLLLLLINLIQKIASKKGVSNAIKVFSLTSITQLSASIILLICCLLINKQRNYMYDYNSGLKTSNVITLHLNTSIRDKQDLLKQEFQSDPHITNITYASNDFLNIETFTEGTDNKKVKLAIWMVDANFLPFFGINISQGKGFSADYNNEKYSCIINRAAYQGNHDTYRFGENIPGLWSRCALIGVSENFNYASLHKSIEPLCFIFNKDYCNTAFIKYTGSTPLVIKHLKSKLKEICPDIPFEYSFLQDTFHNFYKLEEKLLKILTLFCGITILLSCISLWSLLTLIVKKRTKEIGIRKVNGAKIGEILALLNKDFVKWVAIAFVIATPVAYYAMNKWLENFAYKIELSWWIFALAGVVALGIALLTVSWQSWRAATRNPVEALRYE